MSIERNEYNSVTRTTFLTCCLIAFLLGVIFMLALRTVNGSA